MNMYRYLKQFVLLLDKYWQAWKHIPRVGVYQWVTQSSFLPIVIQADLISDKQVTIRIPAPWEIVGVPKSFELSEL